MKTRFLPVRYLRSLILVGLLLAVTGLMAQTQPPPRSNYDRTKAIPQEQSRAEQEAEHLVSLSADKIVSLLTGEPGLFLECKKLLVRTAFAQGRVLTAEELSDDAVFRLVRQDQNIRILFTREIQNRYYVRAKPTKEELERDWEQGRIRVPDASEIAAEGSGNATGTQNQEQAYWLRHERDLDRTDLLPKQSQNNTAPMSPGSPTPAQPQGYVPDPRRAQMITEMQGDSDSSLGGGAPSSLGGSFSGLGNADQMASLLRTGTEPGGGAPGDQGTGDDTSGSGFSRGLEMNGLMGGGFGNSGLDSSSAGAFAALGDSAGLFGGANWMDLYPSATNLQNPQASMYSRYYRPRPPVDLREKQPALRRRPNPYADVPSLYDLYAQYPRRTPKLDRFGIDVFRNGTGNFDVLPMDVPVGPDYVLGPGDNLTINLVGGVSQRLRRVVDREGRIILPEVGGVQVSGRSLGDVQQMVQTVLRTEYRDVQADVSLSRLRTVRVYVVGDVLYPGAYQVSALSTVLNAAYEAGGPTSRGSLRVLNHYRGKQLVEKVDVYDLLLHGVNANMQRLESGDTVQVPPLGQEITVSGMVRRPAVYELNGETSLAQVLELAGGVLPSGTLRHVDVERLEAHESRSMLRLDIPESNNQEAATKTLEEFKIQDGDKIQISPILPYADKTVYLDGYVFRPGKFAYRQGMKVTDLIKSYKDLLPEPYKQHAEIIRLRVPDSAPEILAFNLEDALAGKDQDLVLQPFDTVRVFGRYDFEDPPVITVTGEVRDPGDHLTNGTPHLRDVVYLAGGTTPDALLESAQVFRQTPDGKMTVISVNLKKALDGDEKDNIALESKDRLFIHRDVSRLDPPTVTVEGEVGRAGKYPLGEGMTAAGLVRLAGGFKRGAYTEEADLTRYEVQEGTKVVSDHVEVAIGKAMLNEADSDMRLRDGDVLTIRQISGWADLGSTIKVTGEVAHPGTYGIQAGERLSSVIRRAGGFLADAYAYGSIFQRIQVREMEEKNRSDLIERVQSEASEVKLLPGMDTDEVETAKAAVLQYKTTITNLENTPPSGRLVIHISNNLQRWENTSTDIFVRNGDEIYIPKRPNIVIVDGSVYNPTAITYKPGKNAGWYLRQAGGPTEMANKKAVFVVRADGSVVGGPGGMFGGGAEGAELRPGDMVVVPEKAYSINTKWKTTLEAAQLAYAVGIAIQIGRTF